MHVVHRDRCRQNTHTYKIIIKIIWKQNETNLEASNAPLLVGRSLQPAAPFPFSQVCEEARCPNIGECWGGGEYATATATIMVMRPAQSLQLWSRRETGVFYVLLLRMCTVNIQWNLYCIWVHETYKEKEVTESCHLLWFDSSLNQSIIGSSMYLVVNCLVP